MFFRAAYSLCLHPKEVFDVTFVHQSSCTLPVCWLTYLHLFEFWQRKCQTFLCHFTNQLYTKWHFPKYIPCLIQLTMFPYIHYIGFIELWLVKKRLFDWNILLLYYQVIINIHYHQVKYFYCNAIIATKS